MNKYDKQHLRNLSAIERQVDAVYSAAVKEAAKLGMSIRDFNPNKLFTFADYPITRKRLEKLLETLKSGLSAVIVNGVRSEWTLANNKNNELARQVFGNNIGKLSQAQYRRYFSTNDAARDAFLERKVNGLNLSDRVWRYTNQFKEEIEMGLDVGIRNGRSAEKLQKDLQDFLRYPNKHFRRVRDENGILQLSKSAAAFHPGRGVYRNSYKNARRLAATETNIAYRTADHTRWQQLDFVVGIRVVLSNNHTLNGQPFTDICDKLSAPLGSENTSGRGCYPKDFKFTGWHPHCRCHAETILKTPDELMADNERILQGKQPQTESVNTIKDVPREFKTWLEDNALRIDRARKSGSLPYFIRDNENKEWFGASMASRFDGAYLETMSDKGIQYPERLAEKMTNNPFNRMDVVRLNDDIQSVFAKYGVPNLSCIVESNTEGGINISWSGSGINLNRIFFVDNEGRKVVDHDLFTLPKEMQGKGISKQVFKALYEQYKVAGVQRMEVFANIDIGGYTWARYGFCAKDRNSVIWALRFSALTNKQQMRIMAIVDEHFTNSSDPFPMNKIARLPYGKKALLGGDWEGVLDLTNTHQRRMFERYLRR